MAHLFYPELKGAAPQIPERLTALGIWQVPSGKPDAENWHISTNQFAFFLNFEPVDIPWQGETLLAYKVAGQTSSRHPGAITLSQNIPYWKLKDGTFDFALEIYRVEKIRDNVYHNQEAQRLFTMNRATRQEIRSVPLKIAEYAEWFKDSRGRNLFVVRTKGVLKGIDHEGRKEDSLRFTVVVGSPNQPEGQDGWTAVRPVAA